MIFLDIEVPAYVTSDIQENKMPVLKKTIRGKGTLDKSSDYSFENDIILNFRVNENILKRLLKIYARFKTMTMIPVFDSNLKNKIFDVYSENIKNTLKNFEKNIEGKKLSDTIITKKKISDEMLNETVFYDEEIKKMYNVNPKVKNCVMCFLKSFSFKSDEETSDGFEVEMVLYPCEDLSFYIGNEGVFLKSYYKKFSETKIKLFNEIDKKIDYIFDNKNNNKDILISFENIYNNQETYSYKKNIEYESMPDNVLIKNKYISGIEIRAINNLKRIPITGKSKGFIQNLGQGEIGITLRLVFNQKNIEDEKTIIKLRNLANFTQENIVSSATNFYLTDCVGIKEVNISNIIVSEPTSDVDVTVINLFMIGSLTTQLEEESNYFIDVERGRSDICSKIFNEFLDYALQIEKYEELLDFSEIIISKSNLKIENTKIITSELKKDPNAYDYNFRLKSLFESYYFDDYYRIKQSSKNIESGKINVSKYEYKYIGNGLGGFINTLVKGNDFILKDSVAYDEIANRIFSYSLSFLKSYNNGENEIFIRNLIEKEKKSEEEFFDKVYKYYLAESLSSDSIKGAVGINNIVISNIFKLEIMNNFIFILRNIMDSNSKIKNILKHIKTFDEVNNNGSLASSNKMKFTIDSKMNTVLKEVLKDCMYSVYSTAEIFISDNTFLEKSVDFYILNYSNNNSSVDISKVRSSLEEEKNKLLSKIVEIKDNIFQDDNDIYLNTTLIIFKSMILGNRLKNKEISNTMDMYDEAALLTASVLSLYIPNLNYEKNLIGKISYTSAKNLISPFSLAISTLDISKGIVDEKNNTNENFKFISKIQEIIEYYLGKGSIQELLKLNSNFTTPYHSGKDYQNFLGINIFNNFDSPVEFFQDVLNDSGMLLEAEKYIYNLEKTMKDVFSKYDITNIEKEAKEQLTEESKNEQIDDFLNLFKEHETIIDNTINKQYIGTTIPSTIATTELLSHFSTFRTIRDVFNLVIAQYRNMVPDYEVYIIDEQLISDAYEMGYDIDNKMYSIRNITSINISKNDKTNIKTAIITIANTRPHFIDMSYSFKEKNLFESINNKETSIYSTKFKTDKLVFRKGLLINISLDSKNDFFDFTGKIDNVEISSSEIKLTCSNFASELMSTKFNISHITRTGGKFLISIPEKIYEFITNYKAPLKGVASSKSYYINQHIIPKEYITGKFDNLESNIAGFMPCIAMGLYKAGDTIKHLKCEYNDLMYGTNLSKPLKSNDSWIKRKLDNIFNLDQVDETSERVMENINAVEYDASFYGMKKIDGGKLTFGVSSFIDFETLNNIPKGNVTGVKFSYERDDISLYDLLNDMAYRNPATFWDVIESGSFGTLFFGRNNYNFTRKNKISTVSKTEITNMLFVIQKLLYSLIKNIKDIKNIPTIDFKKVFLVLRNLSIIYDNNLGNDTETEKEIRNIINSSKELSNILINDLKDINLTYEGEYPIKNKLLAISGYNLVSCSLKENENFCNTISLSYRGDLEDKFGRWVRLEESDIVTFKLFGGIPEDREVVKTIDKSLTTDINSYEQGIEFAQSIMYNDLREYYSGKIVTLYQPDIRKNSELVIVDSYNKIFGTVIVRDFQHILSSEAGMVTVITPGLKTSTTSLLSDIFITDIFGWFYYERKKLSNNFDINIENVKKSIDKVLIDTTLSGISVPVTFDKVTYNVKFDAEKGKNKIESKGENTVVFKTKAYKINTEVKNSISSDSKLPFKIYPLVNNGKLLMPDADIYGRTEDGYYSLRKWFSSLCYNVSNSISSDAISETFKGILNLLNKNFFPGKNGYLEDILYSFFPAMTSANLETKNEFIKRILYDDYSNLLYTKNSYGIKIVRDFLEKNNIVFFNVKQLSALDESTYDNEGKIINIGRIEKIAKIIFHFKIVNLVEINRYLDGKLNNKVVELLLEELNKISSTVKGIKCKSWKLITTNSLQNYDNYDDTVALLVNSEENIIKNVEYFDITESYTSMQGKTITKTIKVLKYSINISGNSNRNSIDVYVFHNFYGANYEDYELNVKLRINLLKQLIEKSKDKTPSSRYIILGDFNLNLYSREQINKIIETVNNQNYIIDTFKGVLLKNNPTTTGGHFYDNIIVGSGARSIINDLFDYNVFKYSNSNSYDDSVSDHYPIYLNAKNKDTIFL